MLGGVQFSDYSVLFCDEPSELIDSPCECEHNNPDSLDARLFFTVVLAVAPAVTMDEAGATANTTVKNSRASRESGLLCSQSHGESIGVCPQLPGVAPVEYAKQRITYGILFILSVFCEYWHSGGGGPAHKAATRVAASTPPPSI